MLSLIDDLIWLLLVEKVPGSASSYSVGAQSAYTMGEKVAQSASLYSMSSGSSCASGSFQSSINLKDKEAKLIDLLVHSAYSSGSATSRASNVSSSSSSAVDSKHLHNHNCSTNGCLGAIPRNPSYSSTHFRGHKSHSFRVSCQSIHTEQSITFWLPLASSRYRIEFQICQTVCHPSKSTLWGVPRDTEPRRQSIQEFDLSMSCWLINRQ